VTTVESWNFGGAAAPATPEIPRLNGKVSIGACQGCGACLLTCPTHAIRPRGGHLEVRDDLCTGCLECIEVCPVDAISEAAR
jgi:electron transport complex protein RnfB